jgi:hypothetical protein
MNLAVFLRAVSAIGETPGMADWDKGDEVVANTSIGGVFNNHVPSGTRGEVVDSRSGLLDDYVTVRFENGYTEEVKSNEVKEQGWW